MNNYYIDYELSYSRFYNDILNKLYNVIDNIENIVKEKNGFCTICGKNGKYVIDPFVKDIYDKSIYMCLCDECYKERLEDI